MRKRAEEKFQKDCLDKIETEKIKYAEEVHKRHGIIGYNAWSIGQERVIEIYSQK